MTNPAAAGLLDRLRSKRQLPAPEERKRIREAADCSLRDLASAVGVSQMAIVRWEAGSQPRNPDHAREYGRLLDELKRLE